MVNINIADKLLWGNEAADDEIPEILNSYFVFPPFSEPFFSSDEKLAIVRARKGMGKSALLNELAFQVSADNSNIVLNIKGSDLVAQRPVTYGTPDEHLYDWQQRICMLVNHEIGSKIGFAFTDDEILLVEAAELSGFKKRNLFGSLLSRFRLKLPKVELSTAKVAEQVKLLDRISSQGNHNIWVFVDDIDATFLNTEQERLRLATFFSACRELASNFSGIKIRLTVRTDVWASIRKIDESLDKVEQYISDIRWPQSDIGRLLARRIQSYKSRTGKQQHKDQVGCTIKEQIIRSGCCDLNNKSTWISVLNLVFSESYPWGRNNITAYSVLYILGAGRPRWILQLCRMAAQQADKNKHPVIIFQDVKASLKKFSGIRIDDISREHRHQCVRVSEIINTFHGGKAVYQTDELLSHIEKSGLLETDLTIEGSAANSALDVAAFLYRVNFIQAYRRIDNTVTHLSYEDAPELLIHNTNLDANMHWRIAPAFRGALDITLSDPTS